MSDEIPFRILITVIGLSYTAIRIAYTRMAIKVDRMFFRPAGGGASMRRTRRSVPGLV